MGWGILRQEAVKPVLIWHCGVEVIFVAWGYISMGWSKKDVTPEH